VAADYVQHIPGAAPGRETMKRHLATVRSGFPDIRVHLEALLSEGDDVVARTVTEGTHTGEFMGHPATGRRFKAAGLDMFRVREGRLAEHWGLFDTLGMLLQLGLYRPVPPDAGR
jgi:predicted ester cyclase